MASFDDIYQQTITLFNRQTVNGVTTWYPFVISGVHLIMDKAIIISTYGEQSQDNAKVHIRYVPSADGAVVRGKTYMLPKQFARDGDPTRNFTLGIGDAFDFIMEGDYGSESPIADADYRNGFYNYMNKNYDNVFAISTVSKFNLIPHFEIGAK